MVEVVYITIRSSFSLVQLCFIFSCILGVSLLAWLGSPFSEKGTYRKSDKA